MGMGCQRELYSVHGEFRQLITVWFFFSWIGKDLGGHVFTRFSISVRMQSEIRLVFFFFKCCLRASEEYSAIHACLYVERYKRVVCETNQFVLSAIWACFFIDFLFTSAARQRSITRLDIIAVSGNRIAFSMGKEFPDWKKSWNRYASRYEFTTIGEVGFGTFFFSMARNVMRL